MTKQYQVPGCSLRLSVKKSGAFFVADFFSDKGDWLQDWAVPIRGTNLTTFKNICNLQAFLIENPIFD
jgi:hypothetical protein